MTQTADLFMENDSQALQERLAAFLNRQGTPLGRPDRLATELDCTTRTMRNVLDRHWPSARLWRSIVRRFGRDVLSAVFDPEINAVEARLSAEVRELETQLEVRKAALRSVSGREDRVAEAAK